MLSYVIKRLLLMIPTLIGITIITFAIIRLAPGDPIALKAQSSMDALGSDQAQVEIIEQTRKLYGLSVYPVHTPEASAPIRDSATIRKFL